MQKAIVMQKATDCWLCCWEFTGIFAVLYGFIKDGISVIIYSHTLSLYGGVAILTMLDISWHKYGPTDRQVIALWCQNMAIVDQSKPFSIGGRAYSLKKVQYTVKQVDNQRLVYSASNVCSVSVVLNMVYYSLWWQISLFQPSRHTGIPRFWFEYQ